MCNYNTDVALWRNCLAGTSVLLIEGHIYCPEGGGWIARFSDDDHARRMLTEAGWTGSFDRYYEREKWIKEQVQKTLS